MGNCQAAEVASVVVQHPGNGNVERMYWTTTANEVMSSNPGHYVALLVDSSSSSNNNNTISGNAPLKPQLKLLRPTDTLHVGQVYRLITFEDVIKEFATKKSVKLGKLLKESNLSDAIEEGVLGSGISRNIVSRLVSGHHGGGGQWRPALQSIAELGS